ncbi:hypothetical protein MTO96_048480 [Rhipicephalus appendiculatus]
MARLSALASLVTSMLAAYWRDRMVKMRMAGLNALQTYVEWSGHEPEPGQFNFDAGYNLEAFLDTAADVGLLVVLRPGPYICSERDNGGLPYWLRRLDPQVRCRSSGASYMEAVARWLDVLLPRVRPYMYDNGGPVITVQVENEYGNSGLPCDENYLHGLFARFKRYLGEDVVLFFTDYPTDKAYKCDLASGPLAAREGRSSGNFLKTFETILEMNASVNVYMFHGGTNFGFANGADPLPEPTSYDFEAPLNESGDPTDTYYAIRNITARYLPVPHGPLPVPAPKMNLGLVELGRCRSLDEMFVFWRARDRLKTVTSQFPDVLRRATRTSRSFTVDYANNQFLKDGQPFRYVSGSLHYFRVPRAYWQDRMEKMRLAGLNALQTYVEWSGHEPEPWKVQLRGRLRPEGLPGHPQRKLACS